MVYTLDNLRRALQKIDGVTVQWQGVDGWRPYMALEVAVIGVNQNDYKMKLDLLIKDYLGDGSILYSRLDTSLDMYRVVIADPMKTDHLLGCSIPFGRLRFELLHNVAKQSIPPEDWPIQLPVLLEARGIDLQLPYGVKRYHLTADDAHALEKDLFFFVHFYMDPSSQQQFGPLHPSYYRDLQPRPVKSGPATPSPMHRLHDALCNGNWPEFEVTANSINSLISCLPKNPLGNRGRIPPKPLINHILADLYHRCVMPHLSEIQLDSNASGSTKEVTFLGLQSTFVDKMLTSVHLHKTSTFWDLNCGVGNIAVQVNLETGCQSFGLELVPLRVRIAKALVDEYKTACTMWGFSTEDIGIELGDLHNDEFWDRIKTADLILLNNLVFEPVTDHIFWGKLQSIKLGASVVVLKQLEIKQGGELAHGVTSSGEDTSFSIRSIQSVDGHNAAFYIYRKVKEGDCTVA
jgi:hypothetical protein